MAKLKKNILRNGTSKKYSSGFFNSLAESLAILMALDNSCALGGKVTSCRKRKGL